MKGLRLGREHAREFGIFTAATILYQGGRFLFSLAAAHALAPQDLTAWALVVALLVYSPSLLMGIANGMSRELPILIGRGSEQAAERTVAVAWTATLAAAVGILPLAMVVVIAVPTVGLSPLLVAVLASGTIVFGTQQFILRSRLRFDAASTQLAVFGGLVLVAAAILALDDKADLPIVAALYGSPLLVATVLGLVLAPPPGPPRFDLGEMRRLAGIGFPIMLAGLVFSVFVTLDRWMAVTLLGAQRAAPYALASLIAAAMLVVPTVVSAQTYPRMAIARGGGAATSELRAMAGQQGLVAAGLVAPIALAVAVFAWLGIPLVLPAYVAATPAVIVLSIGFVALGYLTGYGNYLNVVGAQWRYLLVQVVGVACAIGLMIVGGRLFGLVGIASGMALSHVGYGVLLRAVALRTGLIGEEPIA